jgi:carboxypeptidase family protein
MCQLFTIIRRTAGVVCLALWASSCRNAPPTAPTPINPPVTPPAPAQVLSVTGLVTDESGNPIADATVTAHLREMPLKAMTDSQGRYEIAVSLPNSTSFAVVAQKVGYETNDQVVHLLAAATQNFRLYQVVRFVAGESRRLTITSDDSLCAGGSDYHWRCRTIRVQAKVSGTLVLEVVPDDPAEPGEFWTGPAPYSQCCGPREWFSVPAGAEVHVTVLTAFNPPRGFPLNTPLQPPVGAPSSWIRDRLPDWGEVYF